MKNSRKQDRAQPIICSILRGRKPEVTHPATVILILGVLFPPTIGRKSQVPRLWRAAVRLRDLTARRDRADRQPGRNEWMWGTGPRPAQL